MPRNLSGPTPRRASKYSREVRRQILQLHERDGLTYSQIAEKFALGAKSGRVIVGRLIFEERQLMGLRPQNVRKGKPKDDPLNVRADEPRSDGLVNAYILSQKIETPYRLAKLGGKIGSIMYKGMYYSIVRECLELKGLPDGTTIETAWDYSDPLVRACAERNKVYPDHVKTVYVSDDGEVLDDYYSIP